ncbi:RNA polymerase subunit sigma [Alkalihalobacillus alcalophilus ATCC 27647 = CGMCC 1.3604]|uniref:RNA polymerase subunit sigma n=1 Tax=Alkalihalobacillus alcalophilus ATCC 27647 = CGMCC 1.3604 TaxID=1218173 RepID=A0A4S4JXW6_ALKAL|nr:sigma-70 family RNA polymerase sigma factor [Alkalihalobacillus alcalophilus]MED1563034.1 sigma-70 family RNA polymerase sigma factor [Alkalihalobacillus alcalophilus]THG89610.1 RNA polymerase subunit sigma [Alkalihalobacillus alcalophilus ATCC 27647 = CGMCC 1.3604]
MAFAYEQKQERVIDKEEILIEIMNTYGDELLRLIYSYVKNKEVAEDLTQDIFIKVYERIDQFEQRSSLRTWLYRIAINQSKDYLKSWHFRKVRTEAEDFFLSHTVEKTPEIRTVEKAEEEELVHKVFSLPLKYREVIYLFYYQECSVGEISELLKVKEGTVKTRLYQARRKLRIKWNEEDL